MISFGEVPASSVLPVMFNTFSSAGASVTISNFALGDILIYKGTSMTQRSSTAGIVLLDTDGIDIDSNTGIQGFSIDLSDNTDAGFYAVGSFYTVVVSPITVDSQTVSFVAATFRIRAAEATAGYPATTTKVGTGTGEINLSSGLVPIQSGTGTGQLDFTSGVIKANLAQILGTALTETAGQIAAAFKKFFDKATPTGTINSIPDAVPDAVGGLPVTGTRLTSIPWNAAWDAEVESEATDALNAYDPPTHAELTAELATADDAVLTQVALVKAKTDLIPASPAAVGSAMTLTGAYDFAKGTVAMTEAYAANGVPPTPVEALFAIHQDRMDFAISGTSKTVKKLDNATTAFVETLNDGTNPTSLART